MGESTLKKSEWLETLNKHLNQGIEIVQKVKDVLHACFSTINYNIVNIDSTII